MSVKMKLRKMSMTYESLAVTKLELAKRLEKNTNNTMKT